MSSFDCLKEKDFGGSPTYVLFDRDLSLNRNYIDKSVSNS